MSRWTKCIGGQNISADKTYRRTKRIGGQNVSADKMHRQTKCIGYKMYRIQNVSADKTYRHKKRKLEHYKLCPKNIFIIIFKVKIPIFYCT